jgi:hypothetical protein
VLNHLETQNIYGLGMEEHLVKSSAEPWNLRIIEVFKHIIKKLLKT